MSALKLRLICLAVITCSVTLMSGCQPVPLSSNPISKKDQRPVEPLYKKPLDGKTVHDGRKPKSGFKIADPSAKSKPKSQSKQPKKGEPVDVSQQLADASDKAASAQSLAQSAQTKDDWNLVFDRWKRALKILKTAPQQTKAVKQKIAEYNRGLVQATRDAEVSLNPSLAPVDPTGSRAIKTLIGIQDNPDKPNPKTKAPADKSAAPADKAAQDKAPQNEDAAGSAASTNSPTVPSAAPKPEAAPSTPESNPEN
ncbi:hypothetical protein IQ266_01360 [filamentous cyanobacterium LEGE 11480]|uniref:Lipoprotein n=1 Tax=Romeriopsis navalis LEGE 11480 TaxID=2777977 RepID=A0A928VGX3_9CYAN|nr:hypothetical protein [Romeriopsis navalis]MBE9028401.1 hypothetical protein [Romeriopsis navalis LEGE 11480]